VGGATGEVLAFLDLLPENGHDSLINLPVTVEFLRLAAASEELLFEFLGPTFVPFVVEPLLLDAVQLNLLQGVVVRR